MPAKPMELNGHLYLSEKQVEKIRRGKVVIVNRGDRKLELALKKSVRHEQTIKLKAKIEQLEERLKQLGKR